jgi:hypothetical protein
MAVGVMPGFARGRPAARTPQAEACSAYATLAEAGSQHESACFSRRGIAQTLTENPSFVFHAGTHRDTMRIRYADFAWLVKPTVVDITRASGIAAGQC